MGQRHERRGKAWPAGVAIAWFCVAGQCLVGLWPVQAQDGKPQLRIAPRILIEADIETPLMVHVGPADAIPAKSYVQLRGLPEAVQLNEGHNVSPGVWAVPLRALSNLTVNAPQAAAGTSDIIARVISIEGTVLTETKSILIVAQGFQMSQRSATASQPPAAPPRVEPPPVPQVAPPAPQPKARDVPQMRAATVTPIVPPAPPPPVPTSRPAEEQARPVLPADERTRLEKLVALGSRHLGNGNVAAAREFFRRAADGGLAEGALLLASTYDPAELGALKVQGLSPDPAEAKRWYERARALGAIGIEARIARLGGR